MSTDDTAKTFAAVIFFSNNTAYTLSDHHGVPIPFTLEEAHNIHNPHFTNFEGVLYTTDDIDAAKDDTWYAMDTELFSSVFGQEL